MKTYRVVMKWGKRIVFPPIKARSKKEAEEKASEMDTSELYEDDGEEHFEVEEVE